MSIEPPQMEPDNRRLDFISHLPDEILICIISSLSTDEAVRSSILSKGWQHLWKYIPCLNFDATKMIQPLSNLKNKSLLSPRREVSSAAEYKKIVIEILDQHLGELTSCEFKHFPESLKDVLICVKFLGMINKRLSSLSLECVPFDHNYHVKKACFQPGIFSNLSSLELSNYALNDSFSSAFKSFEKLKLLTLRKLMIRNKTINLFLRKCVALEKFSLIESRGFSKLKIRNSNLKFLELVWLIVLEEIDICVEGLQVVLLDSIICNRKRSFRLYSQDLQTFYCGCSQIDGDFLKTHVILENCSDLFESQSINIFRNLLTLSIELDLNVIKESMALSYILQTCLCLNTLDITIPVEKASSDSHTIRDGSLPFLKEKFWDRDLIYNCISHQLKSVTVRGFSCKVQEVNFIKHLITKAFFIEKICVICDPSVMEKAKGLLSIEKASCSLSLMLKSSESKNHG